MGQITVFRVKDHITRTDDIIDSKKQLWSEPVRLSDRSMGVLHVQRSRPREPSWLGFFPGVDFAGVSTVTASSSAVFVLERKSGFYAVVFGFGRYLLAEDIIDERFGLRVVLNAADATQIRSLDHKRNESVPRHTKEQLGRAGTLGQFGLDIERDLLRGVTAVPKDKTLASRLAGADSLSVTGDVSLKGLPALLDRLGTLADSKQYRKEFPWVDNAAQVRDTRTLAKLDDQLVKLLRRGDPSAWLAIPALLDWGNVGGFRYRSSKHAPLYDDVDLDAYFSECGKRSDMSTARLHGDRIQCLRADDGSMIGNWSLHSCLIAETTIGTNKFVLSEGSWFHVDPDFLAKVELEIAALKTTSIKLPKYASKSEGAYNQTAAKKSGGELHLLDRDLVTYPPRGSVEICDLYSKNCVFVHVKRYGASSVLSHLFAQGTVSAELFVTDAGFRNAVSEKLPAPYRWGNPADPPAARQFEVCYAIVARKGKALELPFFSKVNLRAEALRLQRMGYRVSLLPIES